MSGHPDDPGSQPRHRLPPRSLAGRSPRLLHSPTDRPALSVAQPLVLKPRATARRTPDSGRREEMTRNGDEDLPADDVRWARRDWLQGWRGARASHARGPVRSQWHGPAGKDQGLPAFPVTGMSTVRL